MDINYWRKYYNSKNNKSFAPSDFAYFAMSYLNRGESLIDLGCGNGRDSLLFAQNGIKTVAVDQCKNIISDLSKTKYSNLICVCEDFTNLQNMYNVDNAYSRFTLHSIEEKDENKVISWVKKNINGYFFIEVRSDKDLLIYKKADHYRRFLNFETLLFKLILFGFKINFAELSKGFSLYKNQFNSPINKKVPNPILIRIICNNGKNNG